MCRLKANFRKSSSVAATLVVFLNLACAMLAAGETGSVSGKVLDPQGAAVAGAKLKLLNAAGSKAGETVSGQDGNFVLAGVDPGVYQVKAEEPSYVTVMANASVASGQQQQISVQVAQGITQLSGTVVDTQEKFHNDFNERVYEKLSSVYDVAFVPALQSGRRRAIERMALTPGARILEVGVGTGVNVALYPADCHVVGIDLSGPMLEKARKRVARAGVRHVLLTRMDAGELDFPDDTFDVVYAPYVISVVPDPVKVAKEMRRVCRPGGRLILLNHFLSGNPVASRLERFISPFTVHVGFKADLDLPELIDQAGLMPVSIEKVNLPKIWSLVTCIKP